MSHLISPNRQISAAVSHINAIVDEKPGDVVTARQPASGLLVLDSRDRYINASPTQRVPNMQPWNDFIVQKAQSIIPTYAKRVFVTEVRFPWYIPNITLKNNTITVVLDNAGTQVEVTGVVALTPVFMTPTEVATNLNFNLNAAAVTLGLPAGSTPTFQWNPAEGGFSVVSGTLPYAIRPPPGTTIEVGAIPPFTYLMSNQYFQQPSLALTLGIPIEFFATNPVPVYRPLGLVEDLAPTLCLYTDYVDIVSEKLMRFTDARDGGSGQKGKTSLVCRIYCADETSTARTDSEGRPIFPGTIPFVIHRQFKTPKSIQWSPQSFISEMDLQVYDMYGDLVPLSPFGGYPDYQLTLMASEN